MLRRCWDFIREWFAPGCLMVFLMLAVSVVFEDSIDALRKTGREIWSLVRHPSETARVVKNPSDALLLEILQEKNIQARIASKGHLIIENQSWQSANLFNEGYRLSVVCKMNDKKLDHETVNQWNREHIYSRIYINEDGYPALQSDYMMGNEGVSREALTAFLTIYQKSIEGFVALQLEGLLQDLAELLRQVRPEKKEPADAGFEMVQL